MSVIKERWQYYGDERIFAGTYLNSQNALHWHDDCELILAKNGGALVTVNGEDYALGENSAMLIQSGALHKIRAQSKSTLLKTLIFDNALTEPFAHGMTLCSPVLSGDYEIENYYVALMQELREQKPLYVFAAENLLTRLLIEIFRGEKTEPSKPKSNSDARLKRLLFEMRLHYSEYTLDDAAKFMNMNKSYLSRFFTQKTGMHFMQYLGRVRVENAVDMIIKGDKTVTEIAAACGFDTIRNFNRLFKLITGYAPSALPENFVLTPISAEQAETASPTLGGCVLTESSSDKIN